jgi:hypothetical protein
VRAPGSRKGAAAIEYERWHIWIDDATAGWFHALIACFSFAAACFAISFAFITLGVVPKNMTLSDGVGAGVGTLVGGIGVGYPVGTEV